jgi:hypothetical protein
VQHVEDKTTAGAEASEMAKREAFITLRAFSVRSTVCCVEWLFTNAQPELALEAEG